MIRQAALIEVSKDVGPFRIVRASSDGDEKDAQVVNTGGIVSGPVEGSQVLLFQADEDDGKLYALVFAPPKDRVDNVKPGENYIRNILTGATIQQLEDGTMNITSPGKITITAPEIALDGEVILGAAEGGALVHRVGDTDSDGDAAVGSASKVRAT